MFSNSSSIVVFSRILLENLIDEKHNTISGLTKVKHLLKVQQPHTAASLETGWKWNHFKHTQSSQCSLQCANRIKLCLRKKSINSWSQQATVTLQKSATPLTTVKLSQSETSKQLRSFTFCRFPGLLRCFWSLFFLILFFSFCFLHHLPGQIQFNTLCGVWPGVHLISPPPLALVTFDRLALPLPFSFSWCYSAFKLLPVCECGFQTH